MLKILHTADIHLDSPLKSLALRNAELQKELAAASRHVLQKITRLAIEEQAAAVLWAGDLFDGNQRNAQTLAFLMLELEELRRHNIPVYYIKGNHDAENPLLSLMDPPANLHIFSADGQSFELPQKTEDGLPVYLHGVSFSGPEETENLLPKFPLPVPGAVNIGLLHSSVNGAEGHDVYAPCSSAELAAFGYDYWALGHIHKRIIYSEKPWIIMPGCPQGRDIGEDGLKSVSLLYLGRDKQIEVKARPVCDIVFWRAEAELVPADSADAAQQKIQDSLAKAAAELRGKSAPRAIIRLTLRGETELCWQIERDQDVWSKYAEGCARAQGDFWLDKLELALSEPAQMRRVERAEAGENALPVAELAAFMRRTAENEAFQQEMRAELSKIINSIPPELRDKFGASRAGRQAWLQQAMAAGERHILALLAAGNSGAETPAETEAEAE